MSLNSFLMYVFFPPLHPPPIELVMTVIQSLSDLVVMNVSYFFFECGKLVSEHLNYGMYRITQIQALFKVSIYLSINVQG